MSNNPATEKLTFLELIIRYNIVIPIIQRDYAQGREGKEELRKNFLNALLGAVYGSPLELDFVYGNVKEKTLQLLDGQQRITTLFLLHWFVATKENKLDDDLKNLLTKFTYETRTSSTEFCKDIVNRGIVYDNKQTISEQIIDSPWFFLFWKKDPTIKSMLTMLDAIHQNFKDKTEAWDKLNNISFHFIELKNFKLSDDLYIKMNARGKALTDFENFKAKFEQYIKQNDWEKDLKPTETFAHKIDTHWTDLFWKYRNDEKKIDDSILKLMANTAMLFYAQSLEIFDDEIETEVVRKELESKSKSKSITEEAIKRVRIERRITKLFNNYRAIKPEDFATKTAFDYLKKCFEIYSVNNNDSLNPDLNLWNHVKEGSNLFKDLISENSLTYKQRVLFYAQSNYLKLIGNKLDSESFSDWIRVVRNIVENATVDSATTFIGAINLITELSIYCNAIYDFLSKTNIQSKFEEEQVKEEIRKANMIINKEGVKSIVFELEDTSFCKGTINWCLECSDKVEELEMIKEIIDSHLNQNNISNLFRRGLLTIGNNDFYNYWDTWSYSTNTHKKRLIENRSELKNIFTKNYWFNNYLKILVIQLCNNNNDLQSIVDKFTCSDIMPNWKRRLIKESDLLDNYCQGHYMGITDDNKKCYLYGWKQRPASIEECHIVE